jgi:hypothetical protein
LDELTDRVAEILANADAATQLRIVQSHAPAGDSVSPEQWVTWWDDVAASFPAVVSAGSVG